jgi:Tfp pilus assembly protein PilX
MKSQEAGSILLLVLVLLLSFGIMFVAFARLVGLGSHQATVQEQDNQAFHAAEAGVNYALWYINQSGVDPNSLVSVTDWPVRNPMTQEIIGEFDITYEVQSNGAETTIIGLVAGRDPVLTTRTETIEVELWSSSSEVGSFGIRRWQHLP